MEREIESIRTFIKEWDWGKLDEYLEHCDNENMKFIRDIIGDNLPYSSVGYIKSEYLQDGSIPEGFRIPLVVSNETSFGLEPYHNDNISNLNHTPEHGGYPADRYGFLVVFNDNGELAVREATAEEKTLIDLGLEIEWEAKEESYWYKRYLEYSKECIKENNSEKEYVDPETLRIEIKNDDIPNLVKSDKLEKNDRTSIEMAEPNELQEIVEAYGDKIFAQEVGSMELDNGRER
ncbi:MAG: hypothetical protein HPY53_11175 [Brevinematales bacterium]|nr:hypothetical protein [Brevinematales bacterium]